jgi:predicted acetyltransferase
MPAAATLTLLEPSRAHLAGFADALAKGWSPNNVLDVTGEYLRKIATDPDAFLAELLDQRSTYTLPDGSVHPRLPFILRWMSDGDFCGSIALRWQAGTNTLPSHVLGHIGYAVVPWKRRRGYATEALRRILVEARAVGLNRVEITVDPDNVASLTVIESCGGRFVETFTTPAYDDVRRARYRIELAA